MHHVDFEDNTYIHSVYLFNAVCP